MKFRVAYLVWGAMTTGAQASSFVVLDPMNEPLGPSMIVLGSAAPAAPTLKTPRVAAANPVEIGTPLSYPFPGEDAQDGAGRVVVAASPPAEPKRAVAGAPPPDASAYQVPLPRVLSPSIIAFGDVQPPVSYERLASIGPAAEQKVRRRPEQLPMVIRGGLIGDAFARPAAAMPAAPVKV
ncbi:MAG: hypothetical protein F9K19_09815, partial [Rhizobiaceae bacterium]